MSQKVGLALGSGGAKGWSHIGVLRALEEADIEIGYIAGTSIGAIVGAFYAAGELDILEDFAHNIDWKTIVSLLDISFPQQGLLDGDKIYDLLSEHLLKYRIEDSLIPFCCVSTNLSTQQAVCISDGPMVDAVRASLSLPGIFTPVQRGQDYFVDGGLVNPIPVDVVRNMGADRVIAVDLHNSFSTTEVTQNSTVVSDNATPQDQLEYPSRQTGQTGVFTHLEQTYNEVRDTVQDKIDQWMSDNEPTLNIFDVIGNSIDVMEQRLTRSNMKIHQPDILIEVDVKQIGTFDFHQASHAIQTGYCQTKRQLSEIQQLLSS